MPLVMSEAKSSFSFHDKSMSLLARSSSRQPPFTYCEQTKDGTCVAGRRVSWSPPGVGTKSGIPVPPQAFLFIHNTVSESLQRHCQAASLYTCSSNPVPLLPHTGLSWSCGGTGPPQNPLWPLCLNLTALQCLCPAPAMRGCGAERNRSLPKAACSSRVTHSSLLAQSTLKAITFYLQNGVQLVILYAYPKVPKQDAPKQRKQAIKVPFNPSPQNCHRDTETAPAPYVPPPMARGHAYLTMLGWESFCSRLISRTITSWSTSFL